MESQKDDVIRHMAGDARSLAGMFTVMPIADQEIDQAIIRHQGKADILFHAMTLLYPTHPLMWEGEPSIYHSHCRELLERVARGQDTRPGTTAEIACVLVDVWQAAPMPSHVYGLTLRMWRKAGFPMDADTVRDLKYHEQAEGSLIDDEERTARRKAADETRRLPKVIECDGTHRDYPAKWCRYYRAAQQKAR